jgi:NAD(P)-dependent dehydrogenase (short-subunit alcohol dehydrogenase family)
VFFLLEGRTGRDDDTDRCCGSGLGRAWLGTAPGGTTKTLRSVLSKIKFPIRTTVEAIPNTLTPLGRIGTSADIAKVVVFLASDDSGWVTGEIILATGGLR